MGGGTAVRLFGWHAFTARARDSRSSFANQRTRKRLAGIFALDNELAQANARAYAAASIHFAGAATRARAQRAKVDALEFARRRRWRNRRVCAFISWDVIAPTVSREYSNDAASRANRADCNDCARAHRGSANAAARADVCAKRCRHFQYRANAHHGYGASARRSERGDTANACRAD